VKPVLNIPAKSGVYIIKNTKTNQSYIGSSINMQKRCNAHRCLLNNSKHTNIKLQRSYAKYGEGVFVFSVLEFSNPGKIIERERFFVDAENPFFNIRVVIQSNIGIKLSKKTRLRMSISKKGKPLSEAQLAHLHNLHKKRIGKKVAGKVKEALKLGPISLIGKHLNQITKDKIRHSKLGKKFNNLTRKYECK